MQEHETMPPHTLFTVPALAGQHRLLLCTYRFSTFTDTSRTPMKIGCADGVCSHQNHVLTASSASDSACSEQLPKFHTHTWGCRNRVASLYMHNLRAPTALAPSL